MASATFEIFPLSIQYMHIHCFIWLIWRIFLHDSVFRCIFETWYQESLRKIYSPVGLKEIQGF